METLYFKGIPCHTSGNVPVAGENAPDFTLCAANLSEIKLSDYRGKRVVLNIFPSLDTAVCAASVRRFNKEAASFDNAVVICISMDLPFAMSRFCTTEGLQRVITASAFRSPEFARAYGVELVDGPLKGLLARAVIIVDEDGKVVYSDLVNEITDEPDYAGAVYVLKRDVR